MNKLVIEFQCPYCNSINLLRFYADDIIESQFKNCRICDRKFRYYVDAKVIVNYAYTEPL